MEIENEIFKRMKCNFKKLVNYGFVKCDHIYKYTKEILNSSFRVAITILEDGTIDGKIYDLDVNEEYINFRVNGQIGEFANQVREEYRNILNDIAKKCFTKEYFLFEQTNRIAEQINKMYQDEPEFAWDKFPGYGIYRNNINKKWYALIMNINRSKIEEATGEVEIVNVKLNPESIPVLLKKKGFYPSYHMQKKNWISIILDDTLTDEEIMQYIIESHQFTEQSEEWIVPANPKYYDMINCFKDTDTIIWKQSSRIEVGDIVYMYIAAPYSCILYQCEAIEVNIPYEYADKNLSMKKVMKLKLIQKYNQDVYPFQKLKELGVTAIRGPRLITPKLKKEFNQKENKNDIKC